MLRNISYYLILGKPLIIYLGILTLTSFFITALIGLLNYKGKHFIPFKWHPRMAVFSLGLALIHGLLALLSYF